MSDKWLTFKDIKNSYKLTNKKAKFNFLKWVENLTRLVFLTEHIDDQQAHEKMFTILITRKHKS